MNYAAEAHINTNYYDTNRKLTGSDGVFPTETMRLHNRIFGWHRKRHIPVVDANARNNLNAYLIDPQYLDESATEQEHAKAIPVTHVPSNLPVYQYSKITRNYDSSTFAEAGPLSIAAGRLVHGIKLGFGAFTSDLIARYRAFRTQGTTAHYAIGSGVSPWWKQRIRLFATAVITGGLLIAAIAFTPDNTTKPRPVSAELNPAVTDKTTPSNTSTKSSMISSPANNQTSATTPNHASVSQHPLLSTPTQPKLSAQQLVTSPTNSATTTPTAPITSTTQTVPTAPLPAPSTPSPTINNLTDPILTPVTNTVNDVLSTQITVTTP